MCGIFGFVNGTESTFDGTKFKNLVQTLGRKSESRGKDSSGLFAWCADEAAIYKGPLPISRLLKEASVNQLLNEVGESGHGGALGHARLVTNGSQLNSNNNQPVQVGGVIGVHNGIITNVEALWKEFPELQRNFDIDTEVLFAIIDLFIRRDGFTVEKAIVAALQKIEGTAAIAVVVPRRHQMVLATNNGSLYYAIIDGGHLVFASERRILLESLRALGDHSEVVTIEALTQRSFDLSSLEHWRFPGEAEAKKETGSLVDSGCRSVETIEVNPDDTQQSAVIDLNQIHLSDGASQEAKQLLYPIEAIKNLRRCSKCVLPETFPFISFDQNGVCNYCAKSSSNPVVESDLNIFDVVQPYRSAGREPDVLIPLSGGRDSIYTLHVAKEELGLNPITFTYDWGMVTDLARRNVARACGELGVENIIVAADLRKKRENIRKNVTAWLKKPALGMIPLFMAGDKYFFYHAHKIKRNLGIDLEIWGVNRLENTDFKTGFSGISPRFDKKRIYSLAISDQIKLFSYVGFNFLASPGYINNSMGDSLGSFFSRFFTPKDHYVHLFDHLKWDEALVEDTIINQYGWEVAVDTPSTWRIGDGTASFYNYIYTLVAGFSENDTFRSNQIRQGTMARDDALRLIYEENVPRYNSIKWYLSIINMDYESTIKRINEIPRLY